MKEFIVIKVGDYERPASEEDIEQIRSRFQEFCEASDMEDVNAFVTHHAVEIDILPRRKPSVFKRIFQRLF
jgi:hypothetical protein